MPYLSNASDLDGDERQLVPTSPLPASLNIQLLAFPSLHSRRNFANDGLQIAPWTIFIPGTFLALTVLAVNLLGDGLRDRLDPRLARRL